VLCTPTQTFNLQRAHTSNMLLPVAPVIGQQSHDMDMDADLDMTMDSDFKDPYDIHGPQSDESPYEKQAILDMLDSVLDLSLIPPRLERLSELLGRSQFEGWNQESQVKVFKLNVWLYSNFVAGSSLLRKKKLYRLIPSTRTFGIISGTFVYLESAAVRHSGKRQGDPSMAQGSTCMPDQRYHIVKHTMLWPTMQLSRLQDGLTAA